MLEGQLVRLRPIEPGDAERCYRWYNDDEVTSTLFAVRYPISMVHEERFLSERPANDFTNGLFLAIETKDGRHIGNINLFDVRAEDSKAGFGIAIGEKDCWSQGYGTDAVVTLLGFAFDEMNLHRVWLTTVEYNERAQACYLKCGFREEARLRQHVFRHGRYWDVVQMGILRDEFEALHGAAQ
jgi:RimJ/RimL family protein N-acetyltransferase